MRKSLDESEYRRTRSFSQSAQSTSGIAGDPRILVAQCPSQRRLNPFCIWRQVNQGISRATPDRNALIPQQFDQ
jgi:hypothetical protein